MASNIILIVSIITQLLLISVFIREYYNKRVKMILILVLAFSLSLISDIFFIVSEKHFTENEISIIALPAILSFMMGIFLFYLFFDMFERTYPNLKEFALYTTSLGFFTGFILFLPLLNQQLPDSIFVNANNINLLPNEVKIITFLMISTFSILIVTTLSLYCIIIPISIIKKIKKIKKNAIKSKSRYADEFYLVLSGFLLYFLGGIFGAVTMFYSPPQASFLSEIGFMVYFTLRFCGQLLIVYVFLTGTSFVFTSHRLDNLILVNEGGLVLFNYQFATSKTRVNELLIGGILTALSKSLKEILGSTEKVEDIRLGDIHLTFRPINEKLVMLLISERSSQFINQALSSFTDAFSTEYAKPLEETQFVDTRKFKEAKNLVDKYFAVKGIQVQRKT